MGSKHNAHRKIFSFKQCESNLIHECVNMLKMYLLQCPKGERPNQTQLVLIFLERLKDNSLYEHLYACKHTTFNECCMDTMDFNDNFDISNHIQDQERRQLSQSSSTLQRDQSHDQIMESIIKRLRQMYQPSHRYKWDINKLPHFLMLLNNTCGICAGLHRIEQCISCMPGEINLLCNVGVKSVNRM